MISRPEDRNSLKYAVSRMRDITSSQIDLMLSIKWSTTFAKKLTRFQSKFDGQNPSRCMYIELEGNHYWCYLCLSLASVKREQVLHRADECWLGSVISLFHFNFFHFICFNGYNGSEAFLPWKISNLMHGQGTWQWLNVKCQESIISKSKFKVVDIPANEKPLRSFMTNQNQVLRPG